MKKPEKYNLFTEYNGIFVPTGKSSTHKPLPAGVYTSKLTPTGQVYFEPMSINIDNLLDLPSPEYKQIISEITNFLKPETRASFEEYGFLYKRSALLHGTPGGGKTGIVNRVAQMVVANGGIVLFDPEPEALQEAFSALEDIQPGVLTMVIYEEFDSWLYDHEEHLLSLLDGEIQKPNTIYIATTNNIDQIPERMRRPGRFSSVIEVVKPNLECREFYLRTKLKNPSEALMWAEMTEGFTIDELKETVLAVKCLNYSIEQVTNKVLKNKAEMDDIKGAKEGQKDLNAALKKAEKALRTAMNTAPKAGSARLR